MSVKLEAFSWDSIKVSMGVTADPAAGAQIADIVVPAGMRRLYYQFQATIVCDATVANRIPVLRTLVNGTAIDFVSSDGATVVGSGTGFQSFIGNSLFNVAGRQYGQYIPLMEVPAGAIHRFFYVGLVAGDNIGVCTYFYKEAPA